jgi:transcriptional regulator with XRE-family HTH domain
MLSVKLKESRNKSGFTQAEVASKLGISERTVRGYEGGKLLPPLDKIKQLADLYNVPTAYLVSESSEMDSVKQWISTLSPSELTELQNYINEQLSSTQA